MKRRLAQIVIKIFAILLLLIIGLGGLTLGRKQSLAPQKRVFNIEARQYAYNPERIVVNKGDTVTIKLTSKDVTHGFFLEGYDIDAKIRAQYPYFWLRHPSKSLDYEQAQEFSFVADKAGKFRYRCSVTCGTFHPFMQGEFIVNNNYLYASSLGLAIGLTLIFFVGLYLKSD